MNIFLPQDLHLRYILSTDAQAMHSLFSCNSQHLADYFPLSLCSNKSLSESINYIHSLEEKKAAKEMFLMGIFNQGSLLGLVYIKEIDWRIPKCELAYLIDKRMQGRGIISIVIPKILNYCFDTLEIEKVFLRIGVDNKASQRIAEKSGFVKEGLLRKDFRTQSGKLVDLIYFGKLRSEHLI